MCRTCSLHCRELLECHYQGVQFPQGFRTSSNQEPSSGALRLCGLWTGCFGSAPRAPIQPQPPPILPILQFFSTVIYPRKKRHLSSLQETAAFLYSRLMVFVPLCCKRCCGVSVQCSIVQPRPRSSTPLYEKEMEHHQLGFFSFYSKTSF